MSFTPRWYLFFAEAEELARGVEDGGPAPEAQRGLAEVLPDLPRVAP